MGVVISIHNIPMDDAGAWKMELVKNMKAVGLPIDMNDLI